MGRERGEEQIGRKGRDRERRETKRERERR